MQPRPPFSEADAVRALMDCGGTLDLAKRGIAEAHVGALLPRPELARLVALDLGDNELGDALVERLVRSGKLVNLESLDLWSNDLSPASIRAIAEPGALPKLRALIAGRDPLGDDGAIALAESALLGQLEELTFSYAEVTARGRDAILHSPRPTRLRLLRIRGVPFDPEAARALAASSQWQALEEIDFSDNDLGPEAIGDDELEVLIRSVDTLPRLRRIVYVPPRIWGNGIDVVEWREKLGILLE